MSYSKKNVVRGLHIQLKILKQKINYCNLWQVDLRQKSKTENFSPVYPGAFSIFLNAVTQKSKFKKFITVYGNTEFKKKFKLKYVNIPIQKKILGIGSQTSNYIDNFIKIESKKPSDIIEVHNRPIYISLLPFNKSKKILYFHNDPLSMSGSKSINERVELINNCSRIIFNSEWSKK